MSFIEILSYVRTPSNDKMLGYVTCRIYGKLIARFRIVPGKSGFTYIQSGSFKAMDTDGTEKWFESLSFDSNLEKEEAHKQIKAYINGQRPQQQPQVQQGSYQSQGEMPF